MINNKQKDVFHGPHNEKHVRPLFTLLRTMEAMQHEEKGDHDKRGSMI